MEAPGIKFKHALVLNPYLRSSYASMGVFPPTGLEYIATSMKGLVGKLSFVDMRYDREYHDIETLCDFIRREVDLLCVGIMWRSGFEKVCDLIRKLPPDVTTVVGGHKATEEVEHILNTCPNVDMVVRGEGEEIIQQIVKGVPYKDIAGLSFRQNGGLVHNPNAVLPDVAKLAFPDRSLRRNDYVWTQNGVRLSNKTFDSVLTARGCPFKCKFCTFSLNPLGQKRDYTERPLESVIDELKTITADVVLFADDNFFTNPKRSGKLCDLIVENGIKKFFAVQARIDVAKHPAILEKAERAGIRLMMMGIESPHDRILKQISKGFTQQDVRDAFKVLNKFSFYIHGYFIYGNIGESEEEMLYIPKFAKELGLDSITFQKLRIEKFSPLREIVDNTPGYHFDHVGGPVYSDRYGLAELKQIRNKIRADFYNTRQAGHMLRKARKLGILSASDIARFIVNSPILFFDLAKKEVQKSRNRRASLKAK